MNMPQPGDTHEPTCIESHIRQGQQYAAQGREADAKAQFRIATDKLVRRYHQAVIGFGRYTLWEWPDEAEDIAQEVFFAVRALHIQEQNVGRFHPTIATIRNNL